MIFFFSYSLQGQKKSSRVRRLHLYLCPPSHVPNPPSLFILTHTWAFVCVIHSRETDDSNLANRGPPPQTDSERSIAPAATVLYFLLTKPMWITAYEIKMQHHQIASPD